MDWKKFFECSCGGEFIAINKEDYMPGVSHIDIGIFSFGGDSFSNLTLKNKLRVCWNILVRGKFPYSDLVSLRRSTAREMGEYLIEVSKDSGDPIINIKAGEDLTKGQIVRIKDGIAYVAKKAKES